MHKIYVRSNQSIKNMTYYMIMHLPTIKMMKKNSVKKMGLQLIERIARISIK